MKKLLKYLPLLYWLVSLTSYIYIIIQIVKTPPTILTGIFFVGIIVLVCLQMLNFLINYNINRNVIIYNNNLLLLPTKYGIYFYLINYKDDTIKFYKMRYFSFKKIDYTKISTKTDVISILQSRISELDNTIETELKKKKEYSYMTEELSTWKPKQ